MGRGKAVDSGIQRMQIYKGVYMCVCAFDAPSFDCLFTSLTHHTPPYIFRFISTYSQTNNTIPHPMLVKPIKLNDGHSMPAVTFGTGTAP